MDLKLFKEMLDHSKITYLILHDDKSGNQCEKSEVKIRVESSHNMIDNYRPNSGYTFFYTDFTFDKDGKLKSIGAWE